MKTFGSAFPLFIVAAFFIFPSCSSTDELEGDIYESLVSESEFREVTFEINADTPVETRCWDNTYDETSETNYKKGVRNLATTGDRCKTDFSKLSLDMIMTFDGDVVMHHKLLSSGNVNSYTGNSYIQYVEKKANSVSLLMTFPKGQDPSKIEMYFSASLSGENWDSYRKPLENIPRSPEFLTGTLTKGSGSFYDISKDFSEAWLWGRSTDWECTYFKKHQVASSNDWSALNSSIILKRMNAEIIILTEQEDYGILANYTNHIYTASNYSDGFPVDFRKLSVYWTRRIITGGSVSPLICSYFPKENKVAHWTIPLPWECAPTRTNNINSSSGGISTSIHGGWVWSQYYKATYNGKEYWAFPPLTMLATEEPSYPVEYDNQLLEHKYINLIADESAHLMWNNANSWFHPDSSDDPTGHYDGDLHFHWTTLPYPEGGIKANKRYVYILGKDFKLWENTLHVHDVTATATSRAFDNKTVAVFGGDFRIIEMDLDEPLF